MPKETMSNDEVCSVFANHDIDGARRPTLHLGEGSQSYLLVSGVPDRSPRTDMCFAYRVRTSASLVGVIVFVLSIASAKMSVRHNPPLANR